MLYRPFVVLAAIIVIGGALPASADVDDDAERFIPRVEMSDAVFNVLSSALETYPFNKQLAPEAKEKNAAALRLMKKLPWPDLRKLDLARFYSAKQPDQYITTWRLPGKKRGGYLLVGPNFKTYSLRDEDAGKTVPAAYADELAALVRSFGKEAKPRHRAQGLYEAADFASCQDWNGVNLFHHAYAAAYYGKPQEARRILREAFAKKATCIAKTYEEWAWRSFEGGVWALANGDTHEEVAKRWKETLRLYRESCYGEQLQEMLGELEEQVAEDEELDLTVTPLPERLPLERRIPYFLARLPQMSKRGFWWHEFKIFDAGPSTAVADSLVRIGRPALPGLIDHLADRRLTRLIRGAAFDQHPNVLRCQDVALACIEKILGTSFYQPGTAGEYFSMATESKRRAVANEVKTWWENHGCKSAVAGLLARLEKAPVGDRLGMLRQIEAEERKARGDAAALLKHWAAEDAADRLPEYVAELARRGDRSLLAALGRRIGEARKADLEKCIAALLEHGSAADYRLLRQACRKDMALGHALHQSQLWGFVYEQIHDSMNPLAAPILVDLLDAREATRIQWTKAPRGPPDRTAAQVCLDSLVRMTGHAEPAAPGEAAADPSAAVDRWKIWWQGEGKAAFLRAHPEVREVLEDCTTAQIDPARLPPLVNVAAAAPMVPLYYRVPRSDVIELLRNGSLIVRGSPQDGFSFQFTTRDAAAAWFDRARPQAPQRPVAAQALEPINLDPTPEGVTFDPAGREWLWTRYGAGAVAQLKAQVEKASAGGRKWVTGGKILGIDSRQRIWLLPALDPGLLLGFDPRRHEWIERRAASSVPRPPFDSPDRDLVPYITGPFYANRNGTLFFGDRLGVHLLEGGAWRYQRLFDRNIAEKRYFGKIHRFNEPQVSEDAAGRVYVWADWQSWGWTGTIGYWVYDRGNWRNVDTVERLSAVIPRGRDDVWLVADNGEVSLLKDGRLVTGPQAQAMLCPNLRFERAAVMAMRRHGPAILRLENVTVLEPLAKERYHGLALLAEGPSIDLGRSAGQFLRRAQGRPIIVDDQGRTWAVSIRGLEMMSGDGRQIVVLPGTAHLASPVSAVGPDAVYLGGRDGWWRLDLRVAMHFRDAAPPLPAMVVRIRGCACWDTLGRMWCLWDTGGSPTMVFDGQRWKQAHEPSDVRDELEYSAAFPGADGAMIFWGRGNFNLFDAEGRLAARSVKELAANPRLRKALVFPPPPSVNRFFHLVKDAKGRIWWANGSYEWGVVDGPNALGADAMRLGPGRKAAFSVLCPIGDGGRVLAADDQGAAAFLGLESGHIATLEKPPIATAGSPPWNWLQNTLLDSRGRLWIMSEQSQEGIPQSRAFDSHGKLVASHAGWFMLEDRRKALWFRFSAPGGAAVARLAADGKEIALAIPHLSPTATFAEARDGTVWTLTTSELIRMRAEDGGLTVTDRYPAAVSESDGLWCDSHDRLWMIHTTIPAVGTWHTDLICFATGLPPGKTVEGPSVPGASPADCYAVDDYEQSAQWDGTVEQVSIMVPSNEQLAEEATVITLPDGEGNIYPQRWTMREAGLPLGVCSLDYEPRYYGVYRDRARQHVVAPHEAIIELPTPVIMYMRPRSTPFSDRNTLLLSPFAGNGRERQEAEKSSEK